MIICVNTLEVNHIIKLPANAINKKLHKTGAPTILTSFGLHPATAHSSSGVTIPFQEGMMS